VPIIPHLREFLVAHKLATGGTGYVFGETPTKPFGPSVVLMRAKRTWRRHGLQPIGLHEARHTFASLLIASGVNAKAISTYMGHSSIQVTYDVYGKLMPGSDIEAAALVQGYLERRRARSAGVARPGR
jgi:integrase